MPTPIGDLARFYRPVASEIPSPTLFVGNVGPAVGISAADVSKQFDSYGSNQVDVPDPGKSFLFVTFDTPEVATAAMQQQQGELLLGRDVTISFAKLSRKYRSRAQVPCSPILARNSRCW